MDEKVVNVQAGSPSPATPASVAPTLSGAQDDFSAESDAYIGAMGGDANEYGDMDLSELRAMRAAMSTSTPVAPSEQAADAAAAAVEAFNAGWSSVENPQSEVLTQNYGSSSMDVRHKTYI